MTDTLLACLEYFVKVNTSILSKGWIKLMVWSRILKTLEPVCQVPTMDWTTILLCGLGLAAGYWVYLQFYYIFSFSFVYLVNYHRKHESLWPFKYFYTGRFWTNLFHLTERDSGAGGPSPVWGYWLPVWAQGVVITSHLITDINKLLSSVHQDR